jgi:uncharacterized protein
VNQHTKHGFGLRTPHYAQFLDQGVKGVDVVEAITENFLNRGGRPWAVLERVRIDVPVVLHGVSLSIGGTDPLNLQYLQSLRDLCARVDPLAVSDHLCFGTVLGSYGHDLWPLPYTDEALHHVVQRIGQVQDLLGRQLLIENVSSYVTYAQSSMKEWEFLNEVSERSGCGVLLDVNNVFVSSRNHACSAEEFIDNIRADSVGQLHLAGHSDKGDFILDDHASEVNEDVWRLYERTVARIGCVPTIIEWDENVPSLERLAQESQTARHREEAVLFARKTA